jgi:hypothetical protein
MNNIYYKLKNADTNEYLAMNTKEIPFFTKDPQCAFLYITKEKAMEVQSILVEYNPNMVIIIEKMRVIPILEWGKPPSEK